MKSNIAAILCAFLCLSQTACASNSKPKNKQAKTGKPNVCILATGGTIAGAQSGKSTYGYTSGQFNVEDLINAVPTMKDLANISGEQIANIGSQDMNDEVWLKLSHKINEDFKKGKCDAVVITHGTDTMEETAFYLNLVVKSEKPVVLVGSMRPATAVSADGPSNLYNAVATAVDPKANDRGVLVVMNDQIHYARNVEKQNTTNVETFASPERGPAGLINSGKITWFDPIKAKHTEDSEFSKKEVSKLPQVEIIYAYSNMNPDLIEAAVDGGAKGIVVAGVGDGNMSKEALAVLEQKAKEGILVVRSTRLSTGIVLRNNEVDDDKMGFVASGEFNPEKSRVLAMLALTQTKDPKKVQQMFYTY